MNYGRLYLGVSCFVAVIYSGRRAYLQTYNKKEINISVLEAAVAGVFWPVTLPAMFGVDLANYKLGQELKFSDSNSELKGKQ